MVIDLPAATVTVNVPVVAVVVNTEVESVYAAVPKPTAPVKSPVTVYPFVLAEALDVPVAVNEPLPGVFVVDFGQNIAAVTTTKVVCTAGSQWIYMR